METYYAVVRGKEGNRYVGIEKREPQDDQTKEAAMENVLEMMERQERSSFRPANYAGFDIMKIRNPKTGNTFSFEPKYGMLEWSSEDGDEVCMTVLEWRELMEELPEVMKILGI